MRLSAVLPYQVVTLLFEMERQNTSLASARLVQRSMRANKPSMRGRKRSTRYVIPLTVRAGNCSRSHFPCAFVSTGTRSSVPEIM
ncbi:hypothetical protein D3C86_1990860 [compost metagenome]